MEANSLSARFHRMLQHPISFLAAAPLGTLPGSDPKRRDQQDGLRRLHR
jgi:hypothetical protein